MLLLLSDRIRDALPDLLRVAEDRDALTNLALSHREGKHIVTGPLPLLDALGKARELPAEARGTFRQIKLQHPEAGSLRASVTHLAEIEPQDGAIQEEQSAGGTRYQVPLSYFRDSARIQTSRLIAEDRDDARVYMCAAAAYLFRLRLKGLSINLQPYGGGGANTADTLRDHAREGPTVCVVDGDFKWSDDEGAPSEGATAAKAREAARDLAGEILCTVHVVPCREIENLFPAGLVLDCFVATDKGDFHRRCEQAAALDFFGGGPRVDRLDLKKGLRRKDYETLPEGPRRRYLARVFDEHRGHAPRPAGGFCGDARRCSAEESCACVLFEGIGDGLLARVATRLETMSPQKIAEHLLAGGQPHEPAWREIGRLLFSWACSYPRRRT